MMKFFKILLRRIRANYRQSKALRAIKKCCRNRENLILQPDHPDVQGKPGLAVRVCRVCGCRHFELALDPGKFGLRGASIG